jgi:histidinol dehydrogenase
MFMRVVEGYEQGLALLRRQPRFESSVPASVSTNIERLFGQPLSAPEVTQMIIRDIRAEGDDAIRKYTELLDGVPLAELEIKKDLIAEAPKHLTSELLEALESASNRIRAYHTATMPKEWQDHDQGYGERIVPIERVGIYVPRDLTSAVLMDVIPAKVAGVDEVIVCTPAPSPSTLAAARLTGVDRLFQIGGVQAIAAMAYGTDTVPKVDKIFGAGNIFVALAKREVYGAVDIDGLYGPTETVIIADDTANPILCAADLLAQAEHDEMASPIFLTTSRAVAERVIEELTRQVGKMQRSKIASASIVNNGLLVIVDSVKQGLDLANAYAPEHLCLIVEEPEKYLPYVKNAGAIFLGESSPEVIGDYVAGPSHTMPTGATARFASSLGVRQFLKYIPIVALDESTMRKLGPAAVALGNAEGLTGHAKAMQLRLESKHG